MLAATLFSGIGAPEQAMPHWDWRWCAEIDRFACAVLEARHPASVNLGDVTAHDFVERAAAVAKPDVLVFGSPCQSFSVAGQRLGLDDPRGNLALVALGIVDRFKPRWFVFENVPGLLSSDQGRDFGIFLRTVDELGYRCAWSVLDAQHFGVAQRRERVFVVGHLGDWRRAAAVLLEPEGVRGHHPPRRQKGQGTTHPISPSLTNSGQGVERNGDSRGQDPVVAVGFGGNDTSGPIDVATARNAHGGPHGRLDFESETFVVADPISANEGRTYAHGGNNSGLGGKPGQGYQAVAVALRGREGGATAEMSELPSALRASQGGGDKAHVMAFQTRGSNVDVGDISGTFGSNADRASGSSPMAHSGSAVRRLTPVECEKLQGFLPGYTLVPYRGKPAADGPRYRALGNAMAVPVVRWILQRIEKLDGGA